MSHGTHDDAPRTEAQTRADELRSLAGPVESGAESPSGDAPDARTDPSIDEVREGGEGDLGDDGDAYGLRSMPAQPNPTADDPASNLNM
ncbi:hypothetical protein ICW40_06115 [Actinotalea ferrariae]|uniref:hypothetical protein n=1 Tax=Actinotalea ferrariae TaxID=1386098 RepID=UPI001C8CEB82|nr:hypothetical protein [Actinotalea ferrariae]MBX9244380.1 hypothetical protein [Actinotalea ferrariae]